MKRNSLYILIGILFISLFTFFFLFNTNSENNNKTIDLKGSNIIWSASLNIILNHDSELIIRPQREDYEVPSEISVEIIVNENSVYIGNLEYIPDTNGFLIGKYMVNLNSGDYFNKDIEDKYVYIIIRYNDESSSILLDKKRVFK